MKVAQLLGLQGPWRPQVCRDTDCLCGRSYGPIRVFLWASCSWWTEGLFGQSFSVTPLVQAHRGAPLTGVLLCRSVQQALKGAPWVGSYSVVQCIRHLMGQPLYCSAADSGMWRERGYGDGSTPTCDSAVLPCFHGRCFQGCRIGLLIQFPHPPRAGPVILHSCFSPSSFVLWSFDGSISSFPLVKYSCPLSAGDLQTLLCLKLYSWCICGDRCTPCPPTLPPSCSQQFSSF